MEVTPTNSYERAFTIIVIIFALVVFSSVVSSITAATSSLRNLNQQRHQQDELLRRYLTEKCVSFQVGSCVYDHIRNKLSSAHRPVHESDIQAIKQLPNILQLQLRWDVHRPVLVIHHWFYYMDHVQDGVMEEVCYSAMSEATVLPGSELFINGTPSFSMFFVLSGTIDYYYRNKGDPDAVGAGDVLCEPALWLQWLHRGRVVAPVATEIAVLCANRFREVISRNQDMLLCAQDYARSFSQHYAQKYQARAQVSDLSSVMTPGVAWDMAFESFVTYPRFVEPRRSLSSMAAKATNVLKKAGTLKVLVPQLR